MALVALTLYVTFASLGMGWRSWRHLRRTGSTGFRGISGRPGSLEWCAGVGFVFTLVVGGAAPVPQMLGVLTPVRVLDAVWINAAGILLSLLGISATVYAQNDMGESWRMGVDQRDNNTGAQRIVRPGAQPHLHRDARLRRRHHARHTQPDGHRRIRATSHDDRTAGPPRRRTLSARRARRQLPRLHQNRRRFLPRIGLTCRASKFAPERGHRGAGGE